MFHRSHLPPAIHHADRFIVVRDDGLPIEGHFNEERALHAAQVLSEHNERNGHAARYTVKPRAEVQL